MCIGRIGIDATCWTNWRGFGRFTRSIVQALLEIDRENEYVLFFDRTYDLCDNVPASARHVVARTSAAQSQAISVDGRRSAADLIRMAIAVARTKLNLFFSPSIDGYFPLIRPVATVVMIHDVIPETLPTVMLPDRAARWRRRVKVRAAIRQADIVATGSEYTSRQLGPALGIRGDRVAVIPYGVSERFRPAESREAVERQVRDRHELPGKYLLHVGGFGPNKNIPGLLDSFAAVAAQPRFADASLVFVGSRDDDAVYHEAGLIDRRLASPELAGRVSFLGFQADRELVRLYQAATAVVLPSLTEGFGLPALEAACCGTPAIVTLESPLPETLGDRAITVDPRDQAALISAMERVLRDEGRCTPSSRWADRFRWEISAAAALMAFQRARNSRPRSRVRSSRLHNGHP